MDISYQAHGELFALQTARTEVEAEIARMLKTFDERIEAIQRDRADYLMEVNHRLGVIDGKMEVWQGFQNKVIPE